MWRLVKYILLAVIGAALLKGVSIALFGHGLLMWGVYFIALVVLIYHIRKFYYSRR